MADQQIDIKIVTTQSGDGAKKTADELGKVDQAGKTAAASQAKLGKETDRATAGKASKIKALGDTIKNALTGSMDSAISSAQQLGPKLVGIGAVAMAAVGAIQAIGAAFERFSKAAQEAKKADIDTLTRNTAEAAEQAAKSFDKMVQALGRASAEREGLASIAEEAANLEDQLERQNIANNRNKELSGATDDIDRARINAKYDEQNATLDSKARDRSVTSESDRIDREKQRLLDENENLRKGIKSDRRTVGQLTAAATMAGEESEEYSPNWFSRNILRGRGKRLLGVQEEFIAKQSDLTGQAVETVGGMQGKVEQIKANEQALALLETRRNAVIPAMGKLNTSMNTGGQVASNSAGIEIRRMEQERADNEARRARESAAAAEQEAYAQEAYAYGGRNLSAAKDAVGSAEGQYKASPTVGSAQALKEAKEALKEQEATFKELAQALSRAARENARHAKTAKADLSAE